MNGITDEARPPDPPGGSGPAGCARDRWPIDPLAGQLGVRLGSATERHDVRELDGQPHGAMALVALFGVSLRTVRYWIADGVPTDAADRLAVAHGLLPEQVWPDWLDVDERPSRWCSCRTPVPVRRRCDRCDGLLHPVRHRAAIARARQGSLFDPGEAS